jgi:hypothetical protein
METTDLELPILDGTTSLDASLLTTFDAELAELAEPYEFLRILWFLR